MAANDGPVPVRTLAHAARLIREACQLPRYGISAGEPALDYARLLDRVREVTGDVRTHSLLREELQQSGVTLHEHAGVARFIDPHVIECEHAPRLHAAKIIICTGGMSRRLDLPGFELACTHSDAWTLSSAPPSMLVIGAGATGVQLASIFNAFGSHVTLFEAAPRILMSEDQDVAAAVSGALADSGIQVLENAGTIDRLEPCPSRSPADLLTRRHPAPHRRHARGRRGRLDRQHRRAQPCRRRRADDPRGYVQVDAQLRTTAPHIFAAGDVTGHVMVVHEAAREAYLAATNAVLGATTALPAEVSPLGSFTDPEYASVGLTETTARRPARSSSRPSGSTRCHDRSSTDAPPAFANSSPTASTTPSSAATSSESAPSNSPSSRRSRWQPT